MVYLATLLVVWLLAGMVYLASLLGVWLLGGGWSTWLHCWYSAVRRVYLLGFLACVWLLGEAGQGRHDADFLRDPANAVVVFPVLKETG